MALSPQWLDELRARVTLSSVIMRTVKLQKAGHEWKACCPFHNEKSPSFTVSDQKGFYHCFGCSAHGDVIRWMTDQHGLGFMDAVKELAGMAGMEVPAADPASARRAEKRAGLHDVMQSAQDYFAANLRGDAGAGARDYLKSRGFSAQIMEQFGFGYAPPDRQAMKAALSQYKEPLLIEGGLRIAVDDKEPYDRFRSRLMLPIHDTRGRVIAFGGRILEAGSKAPKYLNSPDTPLFDKGSTLYNLHRAGPACRQSGRMVVVEGYMDVIALADAGVEDAVAPLGTALTENQIELLWRHCEAPIVCFDGDAAGQRAAMRAVSRALPLLRPPYSLRIARLPEGKDPDDIIRLGGKEAILSVLDASVSVIDMIWDYEFAAGPLETPESKAAFKARLMEHTDSIPHPDIRSLYRRAFLTRFSKFAYPERSKFKKSGSDFSATEGQSTSDLLKFWAQNPASWLQHKHTRLGAAIAAGLIYRPWEIAIHAEALSKIDPASIDVRIDALIEFFADRETPQTSEIIHFLRNHDFEIPRPIEWDEIPFPFTYLPTDENEADATFEMAIEIYATWPLVEAAIHRATELFADDNLESEGAWLEQQRLRAYRQRIVDRCLALSQLIYIDHQSRKKLTEERGKERATEQAEEKKKFSPA